MVVLQAVGQEVADQVLAVVVSLAQVLTENRRYHGTAKRTRVIK